MQSHPSDHVWSLMVGAIQHANASPSSSKVPKVPKRPKQGRRTSLVYKPSPDLLVQVLERTSPSCVALSWTDGTCRYIHQPWQLAATRKSGVCALTGARIVRGHLVYQPDGTQAAAMNAHLMILREAIEDCLSTTPIGAPRTLS